MKTCNGFLLVLLFAFSSLINTASAQYSGGSGTQASPWIISNAADLANISAYSEHWDDFFVLGSNIDMTGINTFFPIGTNDIRFQGTFDGNYYSISNLTLNSNDNFLGLFNYIGVNGKVSNLTLAGQINSTKASAGLIAANNYGTIVNCHTSGSVTSIARVGGIAAFNYSGALITNSSSSADVHTSSNTAGGIAASNTGSITASSAYGSVYAGTVHAGGIAGYNGNSATIENCYASTHNTAISSNAGGIAGYCVSGGTINYCISTGISDSDTNTSLSLIGGITGDNQSQNVNYNLWNETTSGLTTACGRTSVSDLVNTGGTTSQIKTAVSSTFYQSLTWTFSDLWIFTDGAYPVHNLVTDIIIDYPESLNRANDDSILIDVDITNQSFCAGGESINMAVFVTRSAEELETASWPTFTIYYDSDDNELFVPEAQETLTFTININYSEFYDFSENGTYYVKMIANYEENESPVLESNYDNNSGPILALELFYPGGYEPDNLISDLDPALFATVTNPTSKSASLSPTDGTEYDIDWTGITVDQISDIEISITNEEEKNITLELYDSDGTTLLYSTSGDDAASLSCRLDNTSGSTETTYYLKAYETSHSIVTAYQLDVSLEYVLPDITPSFASDNTIYCQLGDSATIDVSVTNNSPVPTGSFTCILVSSTTGSFTQPYHQVNQFSISLDANETVTNENFSLPQPTVVGDIYYAFIVDSENTIAESNEDNNITASPTRLHTYQLDSYESLNDNSADTENEILPGVTQTHSLDPASDVDYMYFSLTESSQITVLVNCSQVLNISLYELDENNNTTSITFDSSTISGNNYTKTKALTVSSTVRRFCLRIEENATGSEVSEYTVNLKVKAHAPDLEVQLIDKYLSKYAGEDTSITVKALNTGSVATSNITVELYIAHAAETPEWETLAGSATVSSLDPGNSKTAAISFTTPADSGLYYIMAIIINDEDEINESDITNNNSIIRILAIDYEYTYNGGSGTASDPWQIANALQLDTISEISDHLDDFFILTSDIDMSSLNNQYSSIGTSAAPFTGVFDGQNFTISNYTYTTSSTVTGIFGYTDFSETDDVEYEISNINLDNVNITSTSSALPAGGLIASNGCWVANCNVNGSINAVTTAGLLAGAVSTGSGSITPRAYNCSVTGDVTASGNIAGGLVGLNQGYITSCRITDSSTVTAANYAGGLVGENTDGMLAYCYSWASVYASNEYAAGLTATNSGLISSCYATGSVTSAGGSYENGFCANNTGTVVGCFWNIETSGQEDDGSGSGFVGLSGSEMKDKDIFLNAGWSFGSASPWLMADELMWPRLTSLFNFSGGEGTAESPNIIYNNIDFLLVSEIPNRHYILTKDFDLSDYYLQTSLFGNLENNKPFTGVFDGNGHTISNITIERAREGAGLFGYIASEPTSDLTAGVKNLLINNVHIETDGIYNIAGGLVGYIFDGSISNCAVRNAYVAASMYVGGIAGYAEESDITNCCYTGQLDAALCAGGIAGGLRYSSINTCYAAADTIALDYLDGIAAYNRFSTVSNCFWNSSLCPYGSYGTPLSASTLTSVEFWYEYSNWDMVGETANGINNNWQTAENYYPWLSFEEPIITGDANDDKTVNLFDFQLMANSWLSDVTSTNFIDTCDINNDDQINITDLQNLTQNWQSSLITTWP